MLTNRDKCLSGVPGVFRFRSRLLVRIGFFLASIAALLFAFHPNLHAQSSPLTVQPSTGNVGVGTTAPTAKLDVQGGAISVDTAGKLQKETDWLAIRGAAASHGAVLVGNDTASESLILRSRTTDSTSGIYIKL